MSLQVVARFSVIDESADWIVVDKPAPLIVHPANQKPEPTLLGGVEHLLAYEIENGACPAIVNRLDRDTSGLVIVAKHTAAARELGMIFERREVSKEYLAIVVGWPETDEWVCAQPILRAGEIGPSPIWVRQITHPAGKPCLTRFRVEQRITRDEGNFALVRCFPETGRMHQLRVHLAHAGHPIVGDKLYSDDGADYVAWMKTGWTGDLQQRLLLPRHALHAAALSLPWHGQQLEWKAPLPEDLTDFMAGRPYRETPGVVTWSRHDR
jgi:23S rRNA pseudouridine1911/1915/1917 synthase